MKTMYEQAVEKFGKETADKLSKRAMDPETGYIARNMNELGITVFTPPLRCCRCGGFGMWKVPRSEQALCLKCQDEWMECGSYYLGKHDYVWSDKKWKAAFNEFLQTKPKETNIESHNRQIESSDKQIHTAFPGYFKPE